MSEADDIIAAFESRVIEALTQAIGERAVVVQIVSTSADAIRREWGGARPYIQAIDKRKRDRQIVAAWRAQRAAGTEDRQHLAERFGVHRATVDRVIGRALAKPASGGFGSSDWNL